MKSSRPTRLVLRLVALFLLASPLHALDEWVTLKDCRLVQSDANDGDSFHFEFDGQEYIARLYFVDTPESEMDSQLADRISEQAAHFGVSEPQVLAIGKEATEFTKSALAHPFSVVTRFQKAMGRSKLPRHYAFVFPDGSRQDLGTLLTEAGLARSFGQKARNDIGLDASHYDRLEEKARREGMGVFGGRRPAYAREEPDHRRNSFTSTPNVQQVSPPPPTPVDLTPGFSDMLIADLQASNDALFQAVSGDGGNSEKESSVARININTASRGELESLPGIGDVTAKRIVENRPYLSIEDLRRVPRIGEVAIKRLAPLVEF